jgi:hypothetical protein
VACCTINLSCCHDNTDVNASLRSVLIDQILILHVTSMSGKYMRGVAAGRGVGSIKRLGGGGAPDYRGTSGD